MIDIFDGKEIVTPGAKTSVPLDINFNPNDTSTLPGTVQSVHPIEEKKEPFELGLTETPRSPGLFEEAKLEFQESSSLSNLSEFRERQTSRNIATTNSDDPNWKPNGDPSVFTGINDKYLATLMGAKNKQDQQILLSKVLDYQDRDKNIENGSFLGWVIGGFAGLSPIGSPESLIPIAGTVKYARYSTTILNSMARAFPGIAAGSVAHEALLNSTKASGNLEAFAVDTFADIVFGEAFAGAGAGIARAIDSGAVWDLRKTLLPHYQGIDFKLNITKDLKYNGIKAVDSTGTLSAAQVSYAQDLANSTFANTGLFKIPYFGDGAKYVFNVLSPMMRMMNSPYQTVRAVADRVGSHSFITEGILQGKPAPVKFEDEMNKVKGQMRVFAAQMDALHLVRNGIDISQKPRAVVQGTSYLKELQGKISSDANYTSVEQFHSEIDHAVRSEEPSPHGAVNEAAGMIRTMLDDTYSAWRKAYNLPETWMPPKTAQNYMMRVYNTDYMNLKSNEWNSVISSWLKEADEVIEGHMAPINDMREQVKNAQEAHHEFVNRPNITDYDVKLSAENIENLKTRLKAHEENLQNELKENDDLRIHVDDWNALSANEAKELGQFTKKRDIAQKEVDELKKGIAALKAEAAKRTTAVTTSKTVKTAKGNQQKAAIGEHVIEQEEAKLRIVENELYDEEQKIQEAIHAGGVNPAFYERIEGSQKFKLRNPNERVKFRDQYESDFHRLEAAKAYYSTIMNERPEQLTAMVMHRLTGGDRTNPTKQRSLLVPDHILTGNNAKFLSTNIVPNVVNYKYFFSRRTFLKNVFNDVSLDGGFEPMIESLAKEHDFIHGGLSDELAKISQDREGIEQRLANATEEEKESIKLEKKALDKKQKAIEKSLVKERKKLETAKEQLSIVYDKMMGNRVFGKRATKYGNMIMSYTSAIKLGFVPFTQITDLMANTLQHGIWPFLRDGIVPAIESMGGILKTKDSEALRNAAPHVHLAVQDVLTGYADKNFGGVSQPYFNLGSKLANGLEGVSHFSSNFSGTNYIENGLQHITGGIAQSTFMEYAHAFKAGTLKPRDAQKMLKYGIDLNIWADRFIAEFEKAGGHKTKLGGYNSNFWRWGDTEAANKFGDAVFRGISDTVLHRGLLDAPFFMDHPLGAVLMAFKGWTFASLNRYVIPAMQQADGEKLSGIAFMLAAGMLVSPARRIASGKDPYPEDVTDGQVMWAAIQDSGFFSIFADILADANIATGGWLMGNLRNDRYRDRTMAGLLGPTAGIANDMYSVLGSMWSREVNQADVNKMMRLVPFTQTLEFRGLTNKFVDGLNIPKTRAQARKLNAAEGM